MSELTRAAASRAPAGRRTPGRRTAVRTVCAGVLVLLAAFALAVPLLRPDPAAQDLARALAGPSPDAPFGTDHLGRDVATRLAHATRLSVLLAAVSVGTALLLGCSLGVLAAWRGGRLDAVLRWVSEALMALPALLVVLLFSAMAQGGLWTLYVGLALAQWVEYFRVVRDRAGVVLAGPAVEAAGLLRLGPAHVVRRHVWPELRPVLTTLAGLGLVTSVLALSTLGFVGVGIAPPTPELGQMITEAFPFYDEAPWMALGPVAVLALLTLALFGARRTEELT